MKMKRFIIYSMVFYVGVFGGKCFGQADISMSTHWYNRANYNPASIARTDYIYLFSDVQKQWLGVGGSPTVFNVQASALNYNMHSAFGISLVSDNLGLTNVINPMLTYAYRISNNIDWALSMGLSAGVYSRSIDGSLFQAGTQIDPTLFTNLETLTLPDANLGIEYQTTNFVLGLSTTHLFSIGKPDNLFLNSSHLYGYVIYKNTNSELLNFSAGTQVISGGNLTILEGNVSVRFKQPTGLTTGSREIFDVGVSYRTSNQLILLLGLNITSDLRLGYAYDQSFSVGYSANSTHEIMLEYRIPSKTASYCNCRNEGFWYF